MWPNAAVGNESETSDLSTSSEKIHCSNSMFYLVKGDDILAYHI